MDIISCHVATTRRSEQWTMTLSYVSDETPLDEIQLEVACVPMWHGYCFRMLDVSALFNTTSKEIR